MKYTKKTVALLLSLIMVLSLMPAMAFAGDEIDSAGPAAVVADEPETDIEDVLTEEPQAGQAEVVQEEVIAEEEEAEAIEEEAVEEAAEDVDADADDTSDISDDEDFGVVEGGSSEITNEDIDLYGIDSEEQAAEYILNDDGSMESGSTSSAPKSIKGSRLTGRDLKYYNAFRSIVKKVSAGKQTSTKKRLSVKTILGRRTITAKQLGVKRIGYVKNGTWYITSDAKTAIKKRLDPKNWKRVYTCLLSDLSNESFWVDWYSNNYLLYYPGYRYTTNKITFDSKAKITCRLVVQPEFQNGSIWKVSPSKISAVATAKENAKYLVETFDNAVDTTFAGYTNEQIDFLRLWNYCRWIAIRNTYDDYAAVANYDTLSYKGPWSWVYVFDGNDSTNAVCEGYARAFKYLCDLSKFKSRWIDCQIVSGYTQSGQQGKHMWNIVRMNDGLNYVIDPTWMDLEDPNDGYAVNEDWFLRGAPEGTAAGYTIAGNTRTYDASVKKAFAPAERRLSKNDYYQLTTDKEITLKNTTIKKLTRGKRSFKVKWNKVSSALGALYVDGYQIRYSTKKSMKGAKYVKIKGYARSSKTIKKLKSGKRYYVQIRTYAKVGGKTYYSKWSGKRKVRTK